MLRLNTVKNHTMAQNTLTSYALSQQDIDLITFALRRLAENTGFETMKKEATELIEYIEREKKEKEVA
jgi:hypothetical protein